MVCRISGLSDRSEFRRDAPATLKALGLLPITAVIGSTEIGGTSGTLTGGILTANTKQEIRLKSAKSRGARRLRGARAVLGRSREPRMCASCHARVTPEVAARIDSGAPERPS